MTAPYLILDASLVAASLVRADTDTLAQPIQSRVVRLAELRIETDPIVLGAKAKWLSIHRWLGWPTGW